MDLDGYMSKIVKAVTGRAIRTESVLAGLWLVLVGSELGVCLDL